MDKTLSRHGESVGGLNLLIATVFDKTLDKHGRLDKDIIPQLTESNIKLTQMKEANPSAYQRLMSQYGGDRDRVAVQMWKEKNAKRLAEGN